MKKVTVKVYDRLVPDVAWRVYEVTYELKTAVVNAVNLMNSKRPEFLVVAIF